MSRPKVDIGIACSANQHLSFWGNLMGVLLQEQQRGIEIGQIMTIGSALPDWNKNDILGGTELKPLANVNEKGRNEKTDANRGLISHRFLGGSPESEWKADWIMWFDDDVVVPVGVISSLLALEKDAVAGLYFNGNPPYNPIAYFRAKDGIGYEALYDYPYGSLMSVDSVGMGCTLVHRSVFEKIMDAYTVYVRPNGSLMPVLKSNVNPVVQGWDVGSIANGKSESVVGGYFVQKVQPPAEDDKRAFPFFSMEYGRTEDHHFWELAAAVGVRPWVDTTITCGHVKHRATEYKQYKEYLNERKSLSVG